MGSCRARRRSCLRLPTTTWSPSGRSSSLVIRSSRTGHRHRDRPRICRGRGDLQEGSGRHAHDEDSSPAAQGVNRCGARPSTMTRPSSPRSIRSRLGPCRRSKRSSRGHQRSQDGARSRLSSLDEGCRSRNGSREDWTCGIQQILQHLKADASPSVRKAIDVAKYGTCACDDAFREVRPQALGHSLCLHRQTSRPTSLAESCTTSAETRGSTAWAFLRSSSWMSLLGSR